VGYDDETLETSESSDAKAKAKQKKKLKQAMNQLEIDSRP
jgi:hypothetical protein